MLSDQPHLQTEIILNREIQVEIAANMDMFKRQVELFVEHHREKQRKLLKEGKRDHRTLKELLKNAPVLPDNAVDVFFEHKEDFQTSAEVVEEVHLALREMQNRVNRLPSEKRFYILETINFFSSKISIGRLIPALLILRGEDQRRALCEFILPTFLNINKNVETLAANNKLFDPDKLHIDRGALYTFVSDLAKKLILLFKEDFVSELGDISSPIEFFLTAFDPVSFQINASITTDSKMIFEEMIDEENLIRKIVLDFVAMIQSHEALYKYSLKRHRYYKEFLANLTRENQFNEVDPIDISRILAGCFVANDQLRPDEELIENMIDEEMFDDKETMDARRRFIDELSPRCVFQLINRVKISLQHIANSKFEDEFEEVQRFSVKNLVKSIWKGFVRLIDVSIETATGPIHRVLTKLKETYDSYVKEEEAEEKEIVKGYLKNSLTYKAGQSIPKNLESFAIMTQHFNIVEPDVIAFRGEHDGATHKDFGFNTRIFRQDESLMVQFYHCFKRLFKVLKSNRKVKTITYEKQKKIREYSATYLFGKYMISVGITHLKTSRSIIINEEDLFPYVLLFKEEKEKRFSRVLSREVVFNGKLRIFSEVPFSIQSSIFFYESLYLLFHLLPERDWRAKETQICLDFLIRELQGIKKKKGKLMYCVKIPEQSR